MTSESMVIPLFWTNTIPIDANDKLTDVSGDEHKAQKCM